MFNFVKPKDLDPILTRLNQLEAAVKVLSTKSREVITQEPVYMTHDHNKKIRDGLNKEIVG